MAKKYRLVSFSPGSNDNGKAVSSNLFDLSSISVDSSAGRIKSSLAIGAVESAEESMDFLGQYSNFADLTKERTNFIAFFDKSYPLRREYLRQFAQNSEIITVLDTICDEAIVNDDQNYFAYLNIDRLKSKINRNYPKADLLIDTCEAAYKKVYTTYGWDRSNSAWDYFRKLLIDGVLAFEIIYDYREDGMNAKSISLFKELDPITLEPSFAKDSNGNDIKIWYQFKGDNMRQRIIPDSNIVYISWANTNFSDASRVSYLEGLTRSFNMLRQLDNSRLMWNIQNAQKRIKFVMPAGTMSPDRAKQRLSQIKASYNEETYIDDRSGEITVNGLPKFSFSKMYFFPTVNGASPEISEVGVEGYDMNSIESLKYFWRRFILDTHIPANRFMLDPTSGQTTQMTGESAITREEYAFSRFISRIRNIFSELLLKPTWIQICLDMPEISKSEYLRTFLGLTYFEENLFTLAKERSIVAEGQNTIQSLAGLQYADQTPVFSMRFLLKKYLGISDQDWELNQKYLLGDEISHIKKSSKENADNENPMGGTADEGFSGGPFGGGTDGGFGRLGGDSMGEGSGMPDLGGGDLGGIGEGQSEPVSTPEPASGGDIQF